MILHAVALALVVLGASLAIAFPDWRTLPVALAAHYLGIALLLATAASLVAGLVTLAVGLGVVAVTWGRGTENREQGDSEASFHPLSPVPRPPRAFDVAVLSLVVIGAIGLAASRPLLGAGDDAVDVAVLTGLLACLLGGSVRVAAGLLFVGSAGNALLQLSDPGVAAGITLLVATAQLGLALALAHLRAIERALSGAAESFS
jgi:hypothetical protein